VVRRRVWLGFRHASHRWQCCWVVFAGNQAAQQGFNPGFYNAPSHAHGHRARMGQKNIVGSKVVHPKGLPNHKPQHVPLSHFIGDQMKNSARKVKHQQLMVGSFAIDTKTKSKEPHGQFG
jgi:hypothetical protein